MGLNLHVMGLSELGCSNKDVVPFPAASQAVSHGSGWSPLSYAGIEILTSISNYEGVDRQNWQRPV